MEPVIPTAPRGRRTIPLAVLTADAGAKTCPTGASVNKWEVLKAVRAAAPKLGIAKRPIGILSALLSFHPDPELVAGKNLTVFPSNATLANRADTSEATVTRGLYDLAKAGLIIRRDSPNCKRYSVKGQGGEILEAFGLDLMPLINRAEEFVHLAAIAHQEEIELQQLRQAISLHQREIRTLIETAKEEQLTGDWSYFIEAFRPLSRRPSRAIGLEAAIRLAHDLRILATTLRQQLDEQLKYKNMSSSAHQNEEHYHNSKPHPNIELEPGHPMTQGRRDEPRPETASPPSASYPLGMVREACPDMMTYAPNGISTWRDLLNTAEIVRPWLGISPSAWDDAKKILGPADASTLLAAILQKGKVINCAGGYLRSLTAKARAGEFTLGPVLMALINAKPKSTTVRGSPPS